MKEIIPIRFDGYMQSGGSTKPWRVVAIYHDSDQMEEVPYVVKTFTLTQVNQAHNIGKEFICNALAGQFDLDAPEACLIDINDEDFKATLNKETLDVLAKKYAGKTFASRLITTASIINEQVRGNSFTINDCATLFAFDCLILNLDRGGHRGKPNLLVDDEGFFLIDHELTLYIIDAETDDGLNKLLEIFNSNSWPHFYERHLFYSRLKTYKGPKKNLFDTFEESLRNLDINSVRRLITDLTENDVSVGQSHLLITYLSTLKQNSHKFRSILLGLIA